MNSQAEKKIIREKILAKLRATSPEVRAEKSKHLCLKLIDLIEQRRFHRVMTFLPMPDEADMMLLVEMFLQAHKPVLVPGMNAATRELFAVEIHDIEQDTEMTPLRYRQPRAPLCLQPVTLQAKDLVLVPGVAFDPLGNRLGRGWGCYDRFLATLDAEVMTIGVCFDFQMVPAIPTEAFDIPVKEVIVA